MSTLLCARAFLLALHSVKHAQYEIFWFAHHFFVVFYVCMIFHGPVFVYWVIVPVVLYVLERIWRIKRSQRTVYLKTIKWIPPVLELQFCPKHKEDLDFVEGQYLYLNCPFLSANEVGGCQARCVPTI